MGELLSLDIEASGGGATVRVAGDIDLGNGTQPARMLRCSLVGDLVVDLTEVSFVDSTAIALLIAEHKRRVAAE